MPHHLNTGRGDVNETTPAKTSYIRCILPRSMSSFVANTASIKPTKICYQPTSNAASEVQTFLTSQETSIYHSMLMNHSRRLVHLVIQNQLTSVVCICYKPFQSTTMRTPYSLIQDVVTLSSKVEQYNHLVQKLQCYHPKLQKSVELVKHHFNPLVPTTSKSQSMMVVQHP